jgi:phosphohistidine swiveling domain-containing protein
MGVLALAASATLLVTPQSPPAQAADAATMRQWIVDMKQAPRGPFANLAWFCEDGSEQPARGSCNGHGGGIQHGKWTDRVVTMRDQGYIIANVLAELDENQFVGPDADLFALKQILIERFLIKADDGWVFQAAHSYRGALQAEDEEAGANRLIAAMVDDTQWRDDSRYFLLREVVRSLPHGSDNMTGAATDVRQLAKVIADKDPSFASMRVKIHGMPDPDDAERVRNYARDRGKPALSQDYAQLADDIDTLYDSRIAAGNILGLAEGMSNKKLQESMKKYGALLGSDDPMARFAAASHVAAVLRVEAPEWFAQRRGLEVIEASVSLEAEAYAASNTLISRIPSATRRERLYWLGHSANALYGAGLINKRHLQGIAGTLGRLTKTKNPSLAMYRDDLRYLSRMAEWAGRMLVFYFSEPMEHLGRIEHFVYEFPQDRLRGSPLLFYSAVIDSLIKDANRLAGVEHELFGQRVGAGLRALNAGLVRGRLRVPTDVQHTDDFERDGIYLLPETVSDLPRIAGILTQGEGSSLSHVQLLARNLGIPNVVVGNVHLPQVRSHDGQRVVAAVSPGGVVQLDVDGPRWDAIFGREGKPAGLKIEPDLKKLDLETTELVPLTGLRAKDSGRIAGPKSANLGELTHHFGRQVPGGFVIPFGAFRQLLDRPLEPGGPSVFSWMKERYGVIARQSGDPDAQQRTVREFLTLLRKWIENVDPGPEFRARLRVSLDRTFGPESTYGVFVRSDTNVEDLPGFTGAGLNLTVPNVVGFDNILQAIRDVWASPFTERAYSWRQAHMEQPEYVFPAVLVQLAFPSEKSGVMVTSDVETGRQGYLTVAVNEGIGGAVDGQAAESLLISEQSGRARYLAQATAPQRRVLNRAGGLATAPASGTASVLTDAEIAKLIAFAKDAPKRFPALTPKRGVTVPADVEFGFRNGNLALLQLRPFVDNKSAQRSTYLTTLDAKFAERGKQKVDLDRVP